MSRPSKRSPKWPIPEQFRETIARRQIRDAIDPESSAGDASRSARLLMSMEKQNDEAAQKPGDAEDEQWREVLRDAAEQRKSNIANDELLETQRLSALWSDMQSGPFRTHGEPRSLEDGSSPESN